MTLVLAFYLPSESFLVSDRLISLQRRGGFAGQHDDRSNKNVICVADDGILALGYTGSAYIRGIPTDKFIAECLYGEIISDGVSMGNRARRCRRKIADRLFALRKICSENWTGDFVRILAVGYRSYRRLLRPFMVQFDLGSQNFGGQMMKLNTALELGRGQGSVGALVTPEEVDEAGVQAGLTDLHDTDRIADFLHRIIQNKAASDPTVGSDIMSIRISARQRSIDCKFLSARNHTQIHSPIVDPIGQYVAFTPWVIGQNTILAPSYLAPSEPLCFTSGGWITRLFGAEAGGGKAVFYLGGQDRKPKP